MAEVTTQGGLEVLRAAVASRMRPTRWLFLYPAAVGVFCALLGLEDEGLWGVSHFLVFALVCIVHTIRPTILTWALVVVPLGAYSAILLRGAPAVLAGSPPHSRGEYFLFLALVVTPFVLGVLSRPRARDRDETWATALSIAAACVTELWIFFV